MFKRKITFKILSLNEKQSYRVRPGIPIRIYNPGGGDVPILALKLTRGEVVMVINPTHFGRMTINKIIQWKGSCKVQNDLHDSELRIE